MEIVIVNGKIYTSANRHNSFELYEAPAEFLISITDVIIKQFKFVLLNPKPIVGLDSSYIEFKKVILELLLDGIFGVAVLFKHIA